MRLREILDREPLSGICFTAATTVLWLPVAETLPRGWSTLAFAVGFSVVYSLWATYMPRGLSVWEKVATVVAAFVASGLLLRVIAAIF